MVFIDLRRRVCARILNVLQRYGITVKRKPANPYFIITASTLLVVVCLLAFGEQARHGRYHLDGGRGWDLPAASAFDAGHIQLSRPVAPQLVTLKAADEVPRSHTVIATKIPLPKSPLMAVWFGLRSPPNV